MVPYHWLNEGKNIELLAVTATNSSRPDSASMMIWYHHTTASCYVMLD